MTHAALATQPRPYVARKSRTKAKATRTVPVRYYNAPRIVPKIRPPYRTFGLVSQAALILSLIVCLCLVPFDPLRIVQAQDNSPTATPEVVVQLAPTAVQNADIAQSVLVSTPDSSSAQSTPDPNVTLPTTQIEVVATPEPSDTPLPAVPVKNTDLLAHVVQVGETLNSLAAQTGFSVNDLAERNGLTNPYLLMSGQTLRMPSQPSNNIQLHRVSPGETLLSISAQYGVSPFLLKQTNQLACGTCLVFGQLLRIPAQAAGTASNLPEPFDLVQITPKLPSQGDVIVVRVKAHASLQQIVGSLADRPLHFAKVNNEYVALSGMGALQDPGVYPINIRAIADNGTASSVSGRVQMHAGRYPFENLVVAKQLVPLLDPQVNLDERSALDAILSQFSGTQYWEGPFQLPISGRIVSYFGARRNFNNGILRTYHSGIDLSATIGTPVRAAAPGRVAAVQPFKVRGNVVIIDHGRGVFTIYCHLSKSDVKVGQIVNQGDVIAYTGNTGRVEGPHLHWELAVGGVTVDPLDWIRQELP